MSVSEQNSAETRTTDPSPTPGAPSGETAPASAGGANESGGGTGSSHPSGEGEPAAPSRTDGGEPRPTSGASKQDAPRAPASETSREDAPPAPEESNPPSTKPVQRRTPDPARMAAPALSAEVEAEIEKAMQSLEAESAAAAGGAAHPGKIRGPRVVEAGRERRHGYVVSVGPTDIFLEFGPKELGVVPRAQWGEEEELPKEGDEVEVVVVKYESAESIFVCARPGAVTKADWELLEPGQTVEARVVGTNKGGLELEVAGHRAFMPASHVALDRIEDLRVFQGEKLTCRVQRVDRRGSGNIVLSRRDVLREERERRREEMKDKLKPGVVMEGTVRKIMPFGAFVDLGGVDGLVHLSELSHDRVGFGEQAVGKYVKEGEVVRVQVLDVNLDDNRISLSMKALSDDPFEEAISEVVEGGEVTGAVKNVAEFGAFVQIAPGIEGLVHISELAHRRVEKVEDVVKPGDEVQAKVLKIDRDKRKISLSLKALQEAPQRPGGGRGGRRDEQFTPEPVKETPAMRRLREQAKQREKTKGGLGGGGGIDLGKGLGDLKL